MAICSRQCSRGFTYVGLLFVIATLAVLSAVASNVWSIVQRRDREAELIFVGNQFRNAIAEYYEVSPGSLRRFPEKLEDLLLDDRLVIPMRHLRRLYKDPTTGQPKWGTIISDDGGIMGVYSLSSLKPIKKSDFADANKEFAGKARYSDWEFVYRPANK